MTLEVWGTSWQRRPLELYRLGTGPVGLLLLAVMHGDEPAGEYFCHQLLAEVAEQPGLLGSQTLLVCPVVNPDGLALGTRQNARGVDLNRNFPTRDWALGPAGERYYGGPEPASEPETQALMRLVHTEKPGRIVTIHADLHNLNYDGPAQALAEAMAGENGYTLAPDIGYPTPGSFGGYAGRERSIPTITLELPEGDGVALWPANRTALLRALTYR